jgi:hypothetical protein
VDGFFQIALHQRAEGHLSPGRGVQSELRASRRDRECAIPLYPLLKEVAWVNQCWMLISSSCRLESKLVQSRLMAKSWNGQCVLSCMQVNKIREIPAHPQLVVTHTDAPEVFVWNVDKQPTRNKSHVRQLMSSSSRFCAKL